MLDGDFMARHQQSLWPLGRRSPTIGVNVVWKSGRNSEETHVNVFVDGRADSSHQLPGTVSLGEALIWYGTQLKLKGE